jgi:hypothetical protein
LDRERAGDLELSLDEAVDAVDHETWGRSISLV